VFCQESLHYTATLTGIVLIPRTLAMMALSPVVGRLYNRVQPAFIVGFGVILFAIGSYEFSTVTLATSATRMVVPLVITGFAFACLFVPLTTAALSNTPRTQMADAAGLNSFVRQVGGSVGLTVMATLFTDFVVAGYGTLSAHVTQLRPVVVHQLASAQGWLMAHGVAPSSAKLESGQMLGHRVMVQASVLGFDRVFLLQGVLFLGVIPLLFFLRVKRGSGPAVPVEMPAE
jgi:DHA2 family multidrug resistance protein